MADEKCQGWANHETWALNLWLGNDEGLYSAVREWVEENRDAHRFTLGDGPDTSCTVCGAAPGNDHPDPDDMTKDCIESLFDDLWQSYRDGNDVARSVIEDIGSLWRVDWSETWDAIREMVE